MSESLVDDPAVHGALPSALRTIRRQRRLSARAVAAAMNMPPRSYRRLEAGRGRLTLARLRDFAQATNSDLFALLLCGSLDSADPAVRWVDRKLAAILATRVEDLDKATVDQVTALDAGPFLAAFREALHALAGQAAGVRLGAPTGPGHPIGAIQPEKLTKRQLECLRWVQAGKSSGDIGGILGRSPRTIDEHLDSARRWLGGRTRFQAVQIAVSCGVIAPYP
ncbi:MAG: LuxR C-terminal-related transcriptional regulator [Phenylobacterium sp.]|uniref:helix-turn-helix transcriptional regulator n=1 Tax=Phenylobacterium sp. TaxID=1871053 RepID=UPI00273304C8|nr:LuxR C-terminal-related transcriptional regulator [Phenylobacterium sp.]MDP3749271.1 LuxR C-terminal-related transcriptional regulator [Phenylobacterium sp.]